MLQMTKKHTNIHHSKALKIYPNWDFWFENKSSGNPDGGTASRNTKYENCWKKIPFLTSSL
jgi:hypothetical protein